MRVNDENIFLFWVVYSRKLLYVYSCMTLTLSGTLVVHEACKENKAAQRVAQIDECLRYPLNHKPKQG